MNHGRFKQINPKDDSEDDPLHQKQVGNSFFHQSSQNQVMVSDEKGTLEWTEKDGQKSLRATDSNGKVIFDGIYSWKPNRRRIHVDACSHCSRKEICMGVFDEYAQRFSTKVLSPSK